MNKPSKPKSKQRPPAKSPDTKPPSARDRVFKTAADLFYRKGIRAVGVETIAAEANTTKMSLYRSFPSKDELVAEWLRDHDTHFWQTWDAMAQKFPDDPLQQIRAAFVDLKDPAILKTFRAQGFAATSDGAYDVLRTTAKVLNLDLAKLQ